MIDWIVAALIGLGMTVAFVGLIILILNLNDWVVEVIRNRQSRKIREKNLRFCIENEELLSRMPHRSLKYTLLGIWFCGEFFSHEEFSQLRKKTSDLVLESWMLMYGMNGGA